MNLLASSQKKRGSSAEEAVDLLREKAHKLESAEDLSPLLDRIGESRIVMLGEASHGTHEYYTWRSLISRRLILEKNFNFIAVEGDWPDVYSLNRYIKNYTTEGGTAMDII